MATASTPTRRDVVLLHGWGSGRAVLGNLRRALAERHNVHALDLPGYGGRAACEPYTLEWIVDDLAVRSPSRCAVVGWSLGGQLALTWARLRPQQVDSLVLIAATPSFIRRGDWSPALDDDVLNAFATALATDTRATMQRFISLQARGDEHARAVMQRLRALASECPLPAPAALQGGLQILRESDLRSVLPTIGQRALVIHGDRDALAPVAAGAFLASSLPAAHFSPIEGAGHAPFISRPDICARLMMDHLDE
jgi:pimeloyl-[acyl-carrier protein] methyl ester esterase